MACIHTLQQPPPVANFTSCTFQRVLKIISRGGRADVICGILTAIDPPREVAVKAFRPTCEDRASKVYERSIQSELAVWRLLCAHPHIASFIGTVPTNLYEPRYFQVGPVSDYYVNGTLNEFLRKTDSDCINYRTRLKLLVGVVRGLNHIHNRVIVHGDLKADNVLLDADMTPKIGDFGSSRINCKCYFGPDAQEGTFPWESPELWLSDEENPRTYQSDIWAFGCVALEIQMGMTPWDPDHEGNLWRMRNRQLRARGRCPADEHNLSLGQHPILGEVWGLMRRSWRENPVERPTAAELLDEFELLNDQLNEATAG